MRRPDPPAFASWLVEHVACRYRRESLAGDLIEEFGSGRSTGWYWLQVLQALAVAAGWALRACSHRTVTHDSQPADRPGRLLRYWLDYRAAIVFLALMGGYRSAWADWVRVPTGSMNPTIVEGDRLLIDKHSFGLRIPFSLVHLTRGQDPARGDIVILHSPRGGTLLVKRIVAIPGDTVAMDGDTLIVNGTRARYRQEDPARLRVLPAATRAQHPRILRELGVGPPHDIMLLPARGPEPLDGPVTVPQAMYFVLGDSRDNSADSRYIGFVPRRNIIGRATRVIVSLDPDRYDLPRRGRWWTSLSLAGLTGCASAEPAAPGSTCHSIDSGSW
ncbi:MAG: signal peptidase I [Steroidobacteraceae bacterium]